MKPTQHYFTTQKTTRYFSLGTLKNKCKKLWIVLHGYSQKPEEFIQKFEVFNDDSSIVIAPEGLSRFYIKGYFGNVGASWMTKEDRMHDIIDNINYLDGMLNQVLKGLSKPPEQIIVFGFSQGGATAARWVSVTDHKISHLVVYSSEFPKDISDDALKLLNQKVKTWYVYSDKDEFIDMELFAKEFNALEEKNYKFEKVFFDGKHEVREDVLKTLKIYIET